MTYAACLDIVDINFRLFGIDPRTLVNDYEICVFPNKSKTIGISQMKPNYISLIAGATFLPILCLEKITGYR